MPLKMQAALLGISYSSLFYEPVPPSVWELAIISGALMKSTPPTHFTARAKSPFSCDLSSVFRDPPCKPTCVKWAFLPWFQVQTRANLPTTPDLPVPFAKCDCHTSQPRLGNRHHLHPSSARLVVSHRSAGLVFSLCGQLGAQSNPGNGFCSRTAVDNALFQAKPEIWLSLSKPTLTNHSTLF